MIQTSTPRTIPTISKMSAATTAGEGTTAGRVASLATAAAAEVLRNLSTAATPPTTTPAPHPFHNTTTSPLDPLDPPLNKCNYYVKQNQTVVFEFSNQVRALRGYSVQVEQEFSFVSHFFILIILLALFTVNPALFMNVD